MKYDRDAAINYAHEWYYKNNWEYYNYKSDCANFVSQCLFAGGISMNDVWHSYQYEIKGFWERNAKEIIACFHQRGNNIAYTWDVSDAWSTVHAQYDYFIDNVFSYELVTITSNDDISECIRKNIIEVGDLVYFDHENDGPCEHAAIVSKVENGMIYYAAHTSSRYDQEISKYLESDEKHAIKIIRLHEEIII